MSKQPKRKANTGSFKKGAPGRPVGVKNKVTTAAKEAFALAFEGAGGVKALTDWAIANPGEFFKLYARLIPVELAGTVRHSVTINDDVQP